MGFDEVYDSLVEGRDGWSQPDSQEEVVGDVSDALVGWLKFHKERYPDVDVSVQGDLYKSVLQWLQLAAERAFSQE